MSHPFAHERDDGFGLVDVRVVTGIVQRHEGGVGIVRQQGLLVFFRFKGLVIGQNPSTNGFTPTSFRRFGAVATLETEVDVSERANQPLETQIDDCESTYQPRRTCNRDVGVSFPGLIARMSGSVKNCLKVA